MQKPFSKISDWQSMTLPDGVDDGICTRYYQGHNLALIYFSFAHSRHTRNRTSGFSM